MTHEEIIKAWFAIDELGGDNVYAELSSFHFCGKNDKLYRAEITCGIEYNFYAIAADRYKAMERTINEYSAWVKRTSNENRTTER